MARRYAAINHARWKPRHLQGDGIEIGALNNPLPILHDGARVSYVDYLTTPELCKKFPGLIGIVDVSIITSGESLNEVPEISLDLIIANHVIEHLLDPLKGLRTWHSKLRAHRILFVAFPNIVHCPDKSRRVTPYRHMVDEYERKGSETNDEHVLAFVWAWKPAYFPDPTGMEAVLQYLWKNGKRYLDNHATGMLGANRAKAMELIAGREAHIHHHTFNYESMRDLLRHSFDNFDFPFQLLDLSFGKGLLSEIIFVLRKADVRDVFMDPRGRVAACIEGYVEDYVKATRAGA